MHVVLAIARRVGVGEGGEALRQGPLHPDGVHLAATGDGRGAGSHGGGGARGRASGARGTRVRRRKRRGNTCYDKQISTSFES